MPDLGAVANLARGIDHGSWVGKIITHFLMY
jgi:hypothetical protein